MFSVLYQEASSHAIVSASAIQFLPSSGEQVPSWLRIHVQQKLKETTTLYGQIVGVNESSFGFSEINILISFLTNKWNKGKGDKVLALGYADI